MVSHFLLMETTSREKVYLWLKACAPGFLDSKGNFLWLQLISAGSTWSWAPGEPKFPTSKRCNICFHYCLWCFLLTGLDIQLCIFKNLFLKWDRVLMPTEKCHLPGLQREQDSPTPFIYDKNYLDLKYLKHTSSKLASISSSITLERYRNWYQNQNKSLFWFNYFKAQIL